MVARRSGIVLAAVALCGVTACSSAPSSGSGGPSVTVAATAPANGATLTAMPFASAAKRPGTVILDVRTPEEFAAGHLAGAINVDVNSAAFRSTMAGKSKDVPYAVYCRTGARSQTALDIMRSLGFTQTFHLGGGITAWTTAGLPTTT